MKTKICPNCIPVGISPNHFVFYFTDTYSTKLIVLLAMCSQWSKPRYQSTDEWIMNIQYIFISTFLAVEKNKFTGKFMAQETREPNKNK